jgi:ribonuclease HII
MTLDITIPQQSIVKGDFKSYSIGCASIIAKVYRDNLMDEYAKQYPDYGFEKHKGYGTAVHISAIKNFGLTPIHRRSFTKKWQ